MKNQHFIATFDALNFEVNDWQASIDRQQFEISPFVRTSQTLKKLKPNLNTLIVASNVLNLYLIRLD